MFLSKYKCRSKNLVLKKVRLGGFILQERELFKREFKVTYFM